MFTTTEITENTERDSLTHNIIGAAIHEAQLLSYLKLSDWQKGLLINFNVKMLKDGIKRMIL